MKLAASLPKNSIYFRPMERLYYACRYLKHYFTATNKHGVQSPFVFDLLTGVIQNNDPYYAYHNIEGIRTLMLHSSKTVSVHDLGAGSRRMKGSRKVSKITRYSVKPAKYAQLLFRLINKFQPLHSIEIGTSLGITSLYISEGNKNGTLKTLEGCPETAELAALNFKAYKAKNIELVVGDFKDKLSQVMDSIPQLDFAFIDGNHRKKPTLDYFNILKTKKTNTTLLVFDDIHWSNEMEQAWEEIKNDKSVRVTMDLFHLGLVFFNPDLSKEDFVIRF